MNTVSILTNETQIESIKRFTKTDEFSDGYFRKNERSRNKSERTETTAATKLFETSHRIGRENDIQKIL